MVFISGYGLDGTGIEPRGGATFSAPAKTSPGAYSPSYIMSNKEFPGVKRSGRGADLPTRFSAEVKGTVKLHLYSTSGPS